MFVYGSLQIPRYHVHMYSYNYVYMCSHTFFSYSYVHVGVHSCTCPTGFIDAQTVETKLCLVFRKETHWGFKNQGCRCAKLYALVMGNVKYNHVYRISVYS